MLLAFGDILGLGHSTSTFGYSLALILTWIVVMLGVANFFIAYIIGQVLIERRENQERIRAYDAAHPTVLAEVVGPTAVPGPAHHA